MQEERFGLILQFGVETNSAQIEESESQIGIDARLGVVYLGGLFELLDSALIIGLLVEGDSGLEMLLHLPELGFYLLVLLRYLLPLGCDLCLLFLGLLDVCRRRARRGGLFCEILYLFQSQL